MAFPACEMVSLAPSVESACLPAVTLQLRGWLRGRSSWTQSRAGGRRPAGTAGGPEPHRGPMGPAVLVGHGGGAGSFVLPPGCSPAGCRCAPAGASSGFLGSEAVGGAGRVAALGVRGFVVGGLAPAGLPGGGWAPCLVLGVGWLASLSGSGGSAGI